MHAAYGSEVKLQCAVSDSKADCEWLRNGIELKTGHVGVDGYQRSLHFLSISHDDEGRYECRCGDQFTKATVEVKGMDACRVLKLKHMLFPINNKLK